MFGKKIGIDALSIKQCGFEESFRIASEAGYSGIGLRYDRLREYLTNHQLEDVIDLSRQYHLEFVEMAFLGEWMYWGGIPLICIRKREKSKKYNSEKLLKELRLFFEYCSKLNCKCIKAAASMEKEGDLKEGAKDLAKLCDIAREYGVNIGLEFLGRAKQVKDIKISWEILRKANRTNAGILLDTFHFHQGGSMLADLEKIPVDKIFAVHFCDAKDLPREKLEQHKDRIFPGQGVIPLKEIIAVLKKKGYDGYFDLELFNEDYWKSDPRKIAKEGFESAQTILRLRK